MSKSQISTINTNVRRFATQLQYSAIALVITCVCSSGAWAQDDHSPKPTAEQHEMTAEQHEMTAEQRGRMGALIKVVRESTERFKDVTQAESEGYALQFGCVTGPDAGAMGLHYVNSDLVSKGILDATRPQIVIYEPTPYGGLRLIGADYLLLAAPWDATHKGPPELMGQLFHYWESPNRFGLPAFYTLHVWAWKNNPNGAFVNWHPHVSCQSFAGKSESER